MTVSTGAVVEYHLRQLDQPALTEFIAELWAARGYDTQVEGEGEESVVIATNAGQSTTLYPVTGGRFDTGTPSLPDRAIDAVVAPKRGRHARRIADRTDAELLDAAAVREMLWYAIDRSTRRQLCIHHFGDPPENLRPPVHTRVRAGVTVVGSSTAVVSIVSLVLLGAIIGGVTGVGDTPPESTAPTPSDTPTPATDAEADTETPGTAAPLWNVPAPGVTRDGITNISALAMAHERSLENRSYTLWLDFYQPRDGDINNSRVQQDIDIAVADGRYRIDLSVEPVDSGARRSVRTVYYDGLAWYVANTSGENVTYRRTTSLASSTALAYNPFVLEQSLVLQYLSSPRTEVAGRVVDNGRTYYRVVGHGPPSGFTDVWGYTAVATVDRYGFVTSLRVEYTKIADTGTYEVRFTATYDRLDSTTVETPAWYDRRFGNRSNTANDAIRITERPPAY
ncbi:MAG: hypothetical protein ABEJ48_00670 [Halobacteriales archaeon]